MWCQLKQEVIFPCYNWRCIKLTILSCCLSGCAPATGTDHCALVQLLVAGKQRAGGWQSRWQLMYVTVTEKRLQQPLVFTLSHSWNFFSVQQSNLTTDTTCRNNRENSYMLQQMDHFCCNRDWDKRFWGMKCWPLCSLDPLWAAKFKQTLPWLFS